MAAAAEGHRCRPGARAGLCLALPPALPSTAADSPGWAVNSGARHVCTANYILALFWNFSASEMTDFFFDLKPEFSALLGAVNIFIPNY